MKHKVRYLTGTSKNGLILQLQKELVLDCYVDADFAGLWRYENDQDLILVKSQTGYVFYFSGCPLLWVSEMQTEIAVSTLEAEYIA